MRGYPHFSFWIPITLGHSLCKKTSLLRGTVFKSVSVVELLHKLHKTVKDKSHAGDTTAKASTSQPTLPHPPQFQP